MFFWQAGSKSAGHPRVYEPRKMKKTNKRSKNRQFLSEGGRRKKRSKSGSYSLPRLQNKLFLECGQVTQPPKHVEILPWLRASSPKQVGFGVWSADPASKTCRNFAMARCLASKTSCFWSVVRRPSLQNMWKNWMGQPFEGSKQHPFSVVTSVTD